MKGGSFSCGFSWRQGRDRSEFGVHMDSHLLQTVMDCCQRALLTKERGKECEPRALWKAVPCRSWRRADWG